MLETERTSETIGPTFGPDAEHKIIPICLWTEDQDGNWSTTCGKAFTLFSGMPKENNYNFCPNCGRKIVEKPVDPFDEEEE